MKRLALILVMFFIVAAGTAKAAPHFRHGHGGSIDFNYFYGSLSPYGNWIEIDGVYGWRPDNVSHRWSPYTMGRWVWTSYGWYWDSYEPYGWAVYHYGRWYYDDYYGWMWIPDYEWGPSWVEWRYDDDYIGWAPLPPYAVFRAGIGIHFTLDWHFPYNRWNYVGVNHFCDNDGYRYYVPDRVKYRIHNQTRYRNDYEYRDNRVINRGIDRNFVEKRTRVRIAERDIAETNRLRDNSGSRGRDRDRIEVFRPDENEINRYRDVNRNNVQRADRKSSLNVERVEIGERSRNRNENPSRNETVNPRVERVTPNVQREQVERKREEPRVFQAPERTENPNIERERKNAEQQQIERRNAERQQIERRYIEQQQIERRKAEQQQIEKRNAEQERKEVAPQSQERRTVEPRPNTQPRQEQPQVRERRTEETRQAAPRVERREVDRRESGGGGERSRERRR